MKRLIVSAVSALAALAAAAPASATTGKAQDAKACELQASHSGALRSPDCRPDFPGFTANHNETLVVDER
jgi:hypothetical protein